MPTSIGKLAQRVGGEGQNRMRRERNRKVMWAGRRTDQVGGEGDIRAAMHTIL